MNHSSLLTDQKYRMGQTCDVSHDTGLQFNNNRVNFKKVTILTRPNFMMVDHHFNSQRNRQIAEQSS